MRAIRLALLSLLFIPLTFAAAAHNPPDVEIRMDGSRVAVLHSEGGMCLVYDANERLIGTIDGRGVVRDHEGSALGVVDSRGIIHAYYGDLAGTLQSDGRILVHQELVGVIQPNGLIRGYGGRVWGSAAGLDGFLGERRVAGYLVFLAPETYRFHRYEPNSGWNDVP